MDVFLKVSIKRLTARQGNGLTKWNNGIRQWHLLEFHSAFWTLLRTDFGSIGIRFPHVGKDTARNEGGWRDSQVKRGLRHPSASLKGYLSPIVPESVHSLPFPLCPCQASTTASHPGLSQQPPHWSPGLPTADSFHRIESSPCCKNIPPLYPPPPHPRKPSCYT